MYEIDQQSTEATTSPFLILTVDYEKVKLLCAIVRNIDHNLASNFQILALFFLISSEMTALHCSNLVVSNANLKIPFVQAMSRDHSGASLVQFLIDRE